MRICEQCNREVKAVRLDLNKPHDERKWICDSCYFNKDVVKLEHGKRNAGTDK